MLAKGFQLPPMVHFLQFKDGTPMPLANCITLCKMWSGQCDSATSMVEDTVRKEIDNILNKVSGQILRYFLSWLERTVEFPGRSVMVFLLLPITLSGYAQQYVRVERFQFVPLGSHLLCYHFYFHSLASNQVLHANMRSIELTIPKPS
jgi:hypothetical protein